MIPFNEFVDPAPEILYKYIRISDEHLKILTKREIWFPSPRRFNDPFDCAVPIQPLTRKDQQEAFFRKMVASVHSDKSRTFKRNEVRRFLKAGSQFDHELMYEIWKKQAYNQFGVCSLSASNSSLLLWAHYANSHSGLCIGIGIHEIFKLCMAQLPNDVMLLKEVHYSTELPSIDILSQDHHSQIMKVLLTKGREWEYEQEYRLIRWDFPDTSVELPENAIKEVYLGYKMEKPIREKILETIKSIPDEVAVYSAAPKRNLYGLDFCRLSELAMV